MKNLSENNKGIKAQPGIGHNDRQLDFRFFADDTRDCFSAGGPLFGCNISFGW
jgi:hypothetical protein